jgi:hypothetical protein
VGAAVLVGNLIAWWLRERPVWGAILCAMLAIVALWGGARLERHYLYGLGQRRFRGTLGLRITWLVLLCALVLSLLVVALAGARGWNADAGWHSGPLIIILTLGLYHLSLGFRLRIGRWICLGLLLCGFAILIPGVAALRQRLHVVTAVLAGPAMLASGLLGHLSFRRQSSRADGL